MSERSQVLCKYHISGVCRFGADCAFSHNLADLPSQVCKFYLAGNCAYGDRCRYDHRRPDWSKAGQQRQQSQASQSQASSARTGAGAGSRGLRSDPYVAAWDAREVTDPSRVPSAMATTAIATAPAGRAGPAWGRAAAPRAAAAPAATGNGGAEPADEWEQVAEAAEAAEAEAAAYAEAATTAGASDAGRGGLVLIDDDVGLEQEARRLEAERAAGGAAAVLPWSADLDPWDQRGAGCSAGAGAGGGREEAEEEAAAGAYRNGGELYDGQEYYGDYEYGDGYGGEYGAEGDGYGEEGDGGGDGPEAEGEGEAGQGAGWWGGAGADTVDPAELELCPAFALHGRCAEGEDCRLIHGLECETCHKWRLHPYNEEAAAEHAAECRLRHERLEARLRSADVECGICLERVMHKPSVSDRRFGLMACDHPFCLNCIRSWRERTTDASLATDTAVRTCPICRTTTHFVTPSLVWPATPEEKEAIVEAYKAKLSTIDCRFFAFGEGTCPFSTSCFYRHAFRDGRLEEPVLRRAGNADGEVRVVAPLRLSHFLETPQAQRLLGRRR